MSSVEGIPADDAVADGVVPHGWPEEVRPPGAPDWVRTAVA